GGLRSVTGSGDGNSFAWLHVARINGDLRVKFHGRIGNATFKTRSGLYIASRVKRNLRVSTQRATAVARPVCRPCIIIGVYPVVEGLRLLVMFHPVSQRCK